MEVVKLSDYLWWIESSDRRPSIVSCCVRPIEIQIAIMETVWMSKQPAWATLLSTNMRLCLVMMLYQSLLTISSTGKLHRLSTSSVTHFWNCDWENPSAWDISWRIRSKSTSGMCSVSVFAIRFWITREKSISFHVLKKYFSAFCLS